MEFCDTLSEKATLKHRVCLGSVSFVCFLFGFLRGQRV